MTREEAIEYLSEIVKYGRYPETGSHISLKTAEALYAVVSALSVPESEGETPKGEYIKKEDILTELEQNENFFRERSKKFQDINIERAVADRAVANAYKYLILFTDDLPIYSVPERKTGEYEVDEDGNVNCPFCGMSVYDDFCSHCGAKMRGSVKSFYDRMTEELGENWDMPADMRGEE